MKKSFLQLLLDYFTDIEHYEKCGNVIVKLQNKNLENMNENISKTIKSGSGIR